MRELVMWTAFLPVIAICGCDKVPAPCAAVSTSALSQPRFLPVQFNQIPGLPFPAALALDTTTGTLCRTVDNDGNPFTARQPRCVDLLSSSSRTPSSAMQDSPLSSAPTSTPQHQ